MSIDTGNESSVVGRTLDGDGDGGISHKGIGNKSAVEIKDTATVIFSTFLVKY